MRAAVQRQNAWSNARLQTSDNFYRNREFQLGRLLELQRQLDAAEKVQLYRRVRVNKLAIFLYLAL